MSDKPQSWKAVRDQRRKENFVGRADQLRVFSDNFVGEVPNYMVFAVTGEGGVGKSTLLKQYEAIACSPSISAIVIICDDGQPSPVAAMGYIASELAKHDISHKDFDERYKKYRELQQEIESDPKVPRSALNLLALGVTDFTIKSLRKAPGVGVLFEYADEKAAGEALAQLVNYGITRWGNKDEVQLLREPERILTPLFVELLVKACEKQRLVLMFDVFERTGDMLSPWMLALFNFEYGEFNTRLMFVISGRDPLEQHWTELCNTICRVPLEPFTPDETRLYLSNQDITDERLVSQIHEDSGGLPVLVELLAATKPQPGVPLPDISKDAVARFLQWTPQEERRQVALLAAVPRQFNRDILSAALGSDATSMFNWLSAQSYIRTSTERGWFYHEKVRELMLRHSRNTTPGDLTATHTRLAEFFAAAQMDLHLEHETAYDSETWCRLEQERVYHSVSTQPDRNISVAINACLHASRWRPAATRSIAQACQQVGHETGSQTAQGFGSILSEVFDAYDQGNCRVIIEKLEPLECQSGLTQTARCEIHTLCGWSHSAIQEYEKALSHYDRAIALDDKYAWAIASRGLTYEQMDKYEQALADLDRAIALDEKLAWAIASRGLTYEQMGRYEQALADYDRAIVLDDKYAWAIANRGDTYRQMGKYEQALADYDRAIALDDKSAWAIASRGETYRLMGKYEQALADFDCAIALDDKSAWAIASRGDTYQQMGKYEQAIADYDRAIALDEMYAYAIASRGLTYQIMGKYDQSLADYNRAIVLDDKSAWMVASRGDTYRQMGKYEQAIADYDRAIALDDKLVWAIASRGQTYRRMGNYEQALADLDRAIALDEKDVWGLNQRAATYSAIGNTEAAQADLANAMTLPLEDASDFYNRAVALVLSKQRAEAIEMLKQAFERDDAECIYAKTDDLLDPIRDLPQFQDLFGNGPYHKTHENLSDGK
jgi:tetratricopeptide (TPR) repeat protein